MTDELGNPLPGQRSIMARIGKGKGMNSESISKIWKWIFAQMYGRFEKPGAKSTLQETVAHVEQLLEVAEHLGSTHLLQRSFDSDFIGFGQELWVDIAHNPIDWGSVGYRLRSVNITKEAIIHLAGKWASYTESQRKAIPQLLTPIVFKKACDLEHMKRDMEIELATWRPERTHRTGNEDPREFSKEGYGKDIFVWMTEAIFREWHMTQKLAYQDQYTADDGGYNFFSCIDKGKCPSDENLDRFLTHFHMTKTSEKLLRECVQQRRIKTKAIVRELFVNNTQINTIETSVRHFTCASVTHGEVQELWNDEEQLRWGSGGNTLSVLDAERIAREAPVRERKRGPGTLGPRRKG